MKQTMRSIALADISRRPEGNQFRRFAFTLIELLVVIAIIALLMSLMLPTLASAKKTANLVQCANNMRQICAGMIGYASDHRGRFPPNYPGINWYDADRVGNWVGRPLGTGGVLVCPEDSEAMRSYSMNHWASAKAMTAPMLHRSFWSASASNSSRMILLLESWPTVMEMSAGRYAASQTVGRRSDDAAKLFGANGGVSLFKTGQWGWVNCELNYMRHRKGRGSGTQPIGRLNIGYADGHVDLRSEHELVRYDVLTGEKISTFDSLWATEDFLYP